MEAACNRCHQSVPADSCFCPNCGLPQLVYTSEETSAATTAERWTGAVQDAATVEWRPALRLAMLLAVPAGLLSCGQSPLWPLSLLWMAAAAAWTVTLYARRQRPGWITVGAGARIGMVTGLIAGWLTFALSSTTLYALRYAFRQGKEMDDAYSAGVTLMSQWLQSFSPDPQTTADLKNRLAWSLTPEGRAGSALSSAIMAQAAFVLCAAAGGAIGARLIARRRPQA
jgi:RNA polymerase subunit RPABC4/transcription elongation factor Spt4